MVKEVEKIYTERLFSFGKSCIIALDISKFKINEKVIIMTEEQIKFFCKHMVENGNRSFTKEEKEVLKHAIDEAKNMQQLVEIAIASTAFGR